MALVNVTSGRIASTMGNGMLRDNLESQGEWLFRWRSYLPFGLLALVPAALIGYQWPMGSHAAQQWWQFSCLGISLLGLMIRCLTVGCTPIGTSGRNTKTQIAEELNTSGIYSTMRHPLYLGNYLIALGVAMHPMVLWLPVVYTIVFWEYYLRIMMAEEKFLHSKFGDAYSDWAEKTPAVLPNVFRWKKAKLSFSLRNVLKREYTGFFLIAVLFCAVVLAEHIAVEQRLVFDPIWGAMFFFATAVYLTLRTLKKHTGVLDVQGR